VPVVPFFERHQLELFSTPPMKNLRIGTLNALSLGNDQSMTFLSSDLVEFSSIKLKDADRHNALQGDHPRLDVEETVH
jgi:hypothetical protein